MKSLILGGVRSGKSRLAEQQAMASGRDIVYIATATAGDESMRRRIAAHRKTRPAHWQTIEQPLYLADAIATHATGHNCLLVDCLSLWLTNLLLTENEALISQQLAALPQQLDSQAGNIILVSNETSMGITPLGELSRRFCDEAGSLHQRLAEICDEVTLTIAGLPHVLKSPNKP